MMPANEPQHDFKLPALANYADVRSEPRLDEDVDLKPLCAAVRTWDLEQLNQELSRLLMPYLIEIDAVDQKSNRIILPPGARKRQVVNIPTHCGVEHGCTGIATLR